MGALRDQDKTLGGLEPWVTWVINIKLLYNRLFGIALENLINMNKWDRFGKRG